MHFTTYLKDTTNTTTIEPLHLVSEMLLNDNLSSNYDLISYVLHIISSIITGIFMCQNVGTYLINIFKFLGKFVGSIFI